MKIAFFADSYKPYLSGVTNAVEILAKELRLLGHKVYIFAPYYPQHQDCDPDVFRFPSIAGGYPKFRLAIPFIQHLPEVDLIHAHSPFQAGLLARFISRHRKIPLVYSFHTLFTRYVHYARFVPKGLAKIGIVAYLQAFCRKVDHIITPSNLAKRILRSWKINTSISVIPTGVELHRFPSFAEKKRNQLKEKYRIPIQSKVLLYVGRISKEKNLSFLVDAYIKLERDDTYLVLVGGGPLLKEFRNQIPEKIKKNLILVGEVPYPEVLDYYSMGDIFVFSSLTETQGLVLAEAKAAGLPIVALFAGGLVDVVRSGVDGYLLPRNLETFIEHLKRLLEDDALRQKMGQAAFKDARERFSSTAVAKEVETIYNSLIKRGEA